MFKAVEFKHVKILDPKLDASGKPSTNPSIRCLYCDKEFLAGSYRIRGHLLGLKWGVAPCHAVPDAVKAEFEKIQNAKYEAFEKKRKAAELNSRRPEPDADSQSQDYSCQSNVRKSSSGSQPIEQAFKIAKKADSDAAVARFFIAEGIPFHKIESPHFKEMLSSIADHGHGYIPPSRERLRLDLLEKEYMQIKSKLQPYVETMRRTGATLCSDGWSDVRNHPLMNMILVTHRGAIFDSAVNTEGHTKDAEYIFEQISSVIERIEVQNIVQVITDSAANCVRAGKLLVERYPTITWAPCVAHCIDLLLEDIGKLDWVKEIIEPGKMVAKFIVNHQASLALFRKHSSKEILRPGETRFGTNFIMLQRLRDVKQELQATVVDPEWEAWVERDRYRVQEEADACKHALMDNSWFRKVDDLLSLVRPAIELMRMADSDVPSTGKIYWASYSLSEHVSRHRSLSNTRRSHLKSLVRTRWDMLHSPLHAAGYALDPEFQDHEIEGNEEVMTGFHDMVEKIFPGEPAEQALAVQQLPSFRQKLGIFARSNAQYSARSMPPHAWWSMYGSNVPQLQKLAVRVLSQTTSSCSCERNWSAYDYIHNKRRNRLDTKRAEKLVYIFTNLKLLGKIEAPDYQEQCWTWDEQEEESTPDDEDEANMAFDDT